MSRTVSSPVDRETRANDAEAKGYQIPIRRTSHHTQVASDIAVSTLGRLDRWCRVVLLEHG